VALLDPARASLAKGDATNSLAAIEQYQRAFPRGILAQEAAVMRIEALLVAGDRGGAQQLADAFALTYPTSPYAKRVRQIFSKSGKR
jgi:outer membrane protein assembly factor BamD (BamD/ComL family)